MSGVAIAGVGTGTSAARRKFLRFFPKGFADPKYLAWERDYKWVAHERWMEVLNRETWRDLLARERFTEIAAAAVRVESRTNLLFSFEKMALRDAVRTPAGARLFATGLYSLVHGAGSERRKFEKWCEALAELPRIQTRVLTWPVATVFGFLAVPERHFFLKPTVTRKAAALFGFDFKYQSRPNWQTYSSLLDFASFVRRDLADLNPRDMIDVQSFVWMQGSGEYD